MTLKLFKFGAVCKNKEKLNDMGKIQWTKVCNIWTAVILGLFGIKISYNVPKVSKYTLIFFQVFEIIQKLFWSGADHCNKYLSPLEQQFMSDIHNLHNDLVSKSYVYPFLSTFFTPSVGFCLVRRILLRLLVTEEGGVS